MSYLDYLSWEDLRLMADCDCVPVVVSSKSCPKCGRRAVISQEHFLQLIKNLNEKTAKLEEYDKYIGEFTKNA